MTRLVPSENCHKVAHHFETCQLVAYPDPYSPLGKALRAAGVQWTGQCPPRFLGLSGAPWTNGWGTTGKDVVQGTRWTQEYADQRYADDMAQFAAQVEDVLQDECTQGEFDAMSDMAYNVGIGAFRSSTLLRKFNSKDHKGAGDQLLVWNKSGGEVSYGLRKRCAARLALFQGKDAAEAIRIAEAVQR